MKIKNMKQVKEHMKDMNMKRLKSSSRHWLS